MELKQLGVGALCAAALLGGSMLPVAAAAQTSSEATEQAALVAQIQSLRQLIARLQQGISGASTGSGATMIKMGLTQGVQDEDVRRVQALLASDPTIYPEGLTTGYFGPLTRAAIERFQARFTLPITGELDTATRSLMSEYLKEYSGSSAPAGLLSSAEVRSRVQGRLSGGTSNPTVTDASKNSTSTTSRASSTDETTKTNTRTDDDNDEREEADEDTEITSAEARARVNEVADDVDTLEEAIGNAEDDDVDEDTIDDAKATLDDAEDEMRRARSALTDNDYEEAVTIVDRVADNIADALTSLEDATNSDEEDT